MNPHLWTLPIHLLTLPVRRTQRFMQNQKNAVHWRENVIDEIKEHSETFYTFTDDDRKLAERSIALKYHHLVIRGHTASSFVCDAHHKQLVRQRICVECRQIITDSKKRHISSIDFIRRDVIVDINIDLICSRNNKPHNSVSALS